MVAIGCGEFALVPEMRLSLVGATLQVSNWVSLAGSSSYRTLFATSPAVTSPLTHFWSLAIEGQFYVVWPVVVALFAARRVRTYVALIATLGAPAISAVTSNLNINFLLRPDPADLVAAVTAGWVSLEALEEPPADSGVRVAVVGRTSSWIRFATVCDRARRSGSSSQVAARSS